MSTTTAAPTLPDALGEPAPAHVSAATVAVLAWQGVAVVGVSADPVKKQDAFKTKHALTTPLASDETHEMLQSYGVWGEKSMYGKTYMGIQRTTVLIGPDGRIARIWPKVKIEGHAEEVLEAAKADEPVVEAK